MDTNTLDSILENVRAALLHDDLSAAVAILEAMRPVDKAELFAELDDEDQVALLSEFQPSVAADILEDMEDSEAAELVAALPEDVAITIVNEMEPDEAADLLGDIEPEQVQAVLTGLEDENQDLVRDLLDYPDDTAGGLMTTVFLALRADMSAREAIQQIHDWDEEPEDTFNLFIIQSNGKLCGTVNLYELISAEPKDLLEHIMDPDVIHVRVDADQEECARLMSRYDLASLPVISLDGIMVGIITVDDIIDILEDEATEDIQRLGATLPLTDSYLNSSVLQVFSKRVGWLLVLFLTATLTGSVMRLFESDLAQVAALAVFIPLLIGTGGNAGAQTTSTIIRALAVGDIEWSDAMHAFWHELRIGLILGLGMAVAGFLRSWSWGYTTDMSISVSLAIFAIVVWANGLGAVLPLLATRLKIDPTVISGPVMSTLVDAFGLFIYFSIARWILGL